MFFSDSSFCQCCSVPTLLVLFNILIIHSFSLSPPSAGQLVADNWDSTVHIYFPWCWLNCCVHWHRLLPLSQFFITPYQKTNFRITLKLCFDRVIHFHTKWKVWTTIFYYKSSNTESFIKNRSLDFINHLPLCF